MFSTEIISKGLVYILHKEFIKSKRYKNPKENPKKNPSAKDINDQFIQEEKCQQLAYNNTLHFATICKEK